MRSLKERVKELGLNAMVANWHLYESAEWLPQFVADEECEKDRRSFERRTREARIGQFKPISEFDWSWPEEVDREQIEDLFTLNFLEEKSNVILVGNNGLGKSMIAQNLANTAMLRGISTRFVKASDMLADLAECESSSTRKRRMKKILQCRSPGNRRSGLHELRHQLRGFIVRSDFLPLSEIRNCSDDKQSLSRLERDISARSL